MKKYIAKIQYYQATMQTPWCLVEGEREVIANSEEEARYQINHDTSSLGVDSFKITEIYLTDKEQ